MYRSGWRSVRGGFQPSPTDTNRAILASTMSATHSVHTLKYFRVLLFPGKWLACTVVVGVHRSGWRYCSPESGWRAP